MTDVADKKDDEDLAEGSLLSHLVELRSRLIKIVAAVLVVFLALTPFMQEIWDFASGPLVKELPGGGMIATGMVSVVLAPLKMTFFIALMIAMPVVLYQLWAFVAPGLYKKEKRFAFPLLASSIILFYAGAAFAFYVVFPLAFAFFVAFSPDNVEMMTDITMYWEFVRMVVFAFALAFEVPVATVLIVMAGLTTPDKLGKARPYVFLMAFIVGMFLTPPDVISQTLLAIPVYLLYEAGIIMSRVFVKKPEEPEAVSVK